MMNQLDKDGSGKVDYLEFYTAIQAHKDWRAQSQPSTSGKAGAAGGLPALVAADGGSMSTLNMRRGKENNEAVGKWMADKNLERKVDKLKTKLSEREKELKDVEKREAVLHTIIEKEKTRLSARVRELEA